MADVLSGGRDPGSGSGPGPGPGREFSRSQVLIALVVLVLLVTGGLRLLFGGGDDPAPRPTESPPVRNTLPAVTRVPDGPDAEIDPAEPPGVVVTNVDIGGTHDTIDQRAAAGAWTVVVRRKDGSLGRHGAVITFPVPEPNLAREVTVGGAPGRAAKGVIVWKAVDAWARVRGDLPDADLARIAAATTVTGGRPVVAPVKGFEALVDNPYRSRVVRNARFDAADLGEGASLGDGLVYLSGAICGGLEDRLYEADARPAGKVNGKPAVVSGAFGGNGVLAWEPALGVVAIVGYSGAPMDDDAVAALRRIAERSRLLDVGQWKATRPLARQGTNDFS